MHLFLQGGQLQPPPSQLWEDGAAEMSWLRDVSSRMAFGGERSPQHLSVQAVPADRLSSCIFLEDKVGGIGASPVWWVLSPTASTRQKRHLVAQTTPTACHSPHYFYLKQINTYQGFLSCWKRCSAHIHGAYRNFPKKLLACSSVCLKGYQTDGSGISGMCSICKLPIIFYVCFAWKSLSEKMKTKMRCGLDWLH